MVIPIGCVIQLLEDEVGSLVAGSHAYQCHPMRGRASSLDDDGWVHGTASLCAAWLRLEAMETYSSSS